jgi:3-isopropylmalate dehydrogenase
MPGNVRSYVVTHLPGDGIGPEVTAVARDLVDQAGQRHGFTVDWRHSPLGAENYLRTGEVLPADAYEALRKTDAVLLGAVGSPSVPPGVLERGLLLRLRFDLDLYVNLRPARQRPGVQASGAADLDFVVVRENTEGLYAGAGGIVHEGTKFETATEESLNTRAGVERCIRYAAGLASNRSGKLTLVHKTNVLVNAGSLWMRVAREVADEQGLKLDYCHVDAACLYMVSDPGRFEVIVTDNLFGDILTDLAAALTGGLGLAASGNINPDRTGPSIFEPVHGSAPDIAGTGRANPVGQLWAAVLMLDHLGEGTAASALLAAIEASVAAGQVTPDLGGALTTAQVERDILQRLAARSDDHG